MDEVKDIEVKSTAEVGKSNPLREEWAFWDRMLKQARSVIPAHIKSPEVAMLIVEYGAGLGMSKLEALHECCVINGKVAISARKMHSLALERHPEAVWDVVQCDDKAAIVEITPAPGRPKVTVSFTAEDAKRAKLAGNVWSSYTQDMLWARCVSRAVRRVFPDVISGAYVTEDVRGIAPERQVVQIGGLDQ